MENQSQQYAIKGDIIQNLPIDQTIPSTNEIKIVDTLFKEKKKFIDKFLSNTKDLLILCILFILFSLTQIDTVLQKFIPITRTSQYILVVIKSLMFVSVYFLINNLYLARVK